jgi:hypothetical protein
MKHETWNFFLKIGGHYNKMLFHLQMFHYLKWAFRAGAPGSDPKTAFWGLTASLVT